MGADMGTPEGLALQRRFMRHVVGIYCEFRENSSSAADIADDGTPNPQRNPEGVG
jgi:hypothetical protein